MNCSENCDSFTVTDSNDLEKLLDFIHDEHFSIEDIVFDSSTKILTIPFVRCFHGIDEKIVKNFLIFLVREVPVMRCSLLIMNVEDYTIIDKEGVVTNYFNTIKFDENENTLIIDTCIPTKFEIKVSSLKIQYIKHGFRGKARINFGIFPIPWDSGPRFVKSSDKEDSRNQDHNGNSRAKKKGG